MPTANSTNGDKMRKLAVQESIAQSTDNGCQAFPEIWHRCSNVHCRKCYTTFPELNYAPPNRDRASIETVRYPIAHCFNPYPPQGKFSSLERLKQRRKPPQQPSQQDLLAVGSCSQCPAMYSMEPLLALSSWLVCSFFRSIPKM